MSRLTGLTHRREVPPSITPLRISLQSSFNPITHRREVPPQTTPLRISLFSDLIISHIAAYHTYPLEMPATKSQLELTRPKWSDRRRSLAATCQVVPAHVYRLHPPVPRHPPPQNPTPENTLSGKIIFQMGQKVTPKWRKPLKSLEKNGPKKRTKSPKTFKTYIKYKLHKCVIYINV